MPLKTNKHGTFEPLADGSICPFCHSTLYRSLGKSGKVTLACFDSADCEVMTTSRDIESAMGLLEYNFETRNVPAITGPDTTNEFDR